MLSEEAQSESSEQESTMDSESKTATDTRTKNFIIAIFPSLFTE